jgi:hypothetical protein
MLKRATGPDWKLRFTLADVVELCPLESVTVSAIEFEAMSTVALQLMLHACDMPLTLQE